MPRREASVETTRPLGRNILRQQICFDAFVSEFNEERATRNAGDEGAGRTLRRLAAIL
jgi:hypothetical protein